MTTFLLEWLTKCPGWITFTKYLYPTFSLTIWYVKLLEKLPINHLFTIAKMTD